VTGHVERKIKVDLKESFYNNRLFIMSYTSA